MSKLKKEANKAYLYRLGGLAAGLTVAFFSESLLITIIALIAGLFLGSFFAPVSRDGDWVRVESVEDDHTGLQPGTQSYFLRDEDDPWG
ncbi:hypothetical protein [Marinobacter sp. P4B1]|uniref:hypothetical protein n=1 Tax=Marinobacter sp. P4B1 TaxID=1119533 RepID=UPI00071CF2CA|nr:hypothetical protein [Marinobacter sp. P4B1]KRW83700.1 hypothetical protein AQ621_16760 [Marinobacter sp. P4B1]